MKDFDWSGFKKKIAIKSDLKTIYKAWTIPNELEKWFLKTADFTNENNLILKKDTSIKTDYQYNWSWYLFDTIESGKITFANDVDNLQFTFAGNCLVDVKLSKIDNLVVVTLTQKNIPTDEESIINYYLGCQSGWIFYLANLKSVYEGGLDLRNKNPQLKGMLNN